MQTQNCIKCRQPYESTDVEPYLCESCLKSKAQIAAEIDAKISTVGQVPTGEMSRYDQLKDGRGFARAGDFM